MSTATLWVRASRAVGLSVCLTLGLVSTRLVAQEVTGLEAAQAVETALSDAIAIGEKSVVAIARVKHGDSSAVEPRIDPFGQLPRRALPEPGDPNFIPNEFGTGVVIDKQGLILTLAHVLEDDSEYWVTTADRKPYRAKIKAVDDRSDLAVLSIEATDLTPIKLGEASSLKKGHIVIALGNPYGIARDGQVSASWGIVSNLGRKSGAAPDESDPQASRPLHRLGGLIQTDAKLNLGTSGGALLNLKGEMVGLTTALAAQVGYEQAAGYAVPVDETFRRVIGQLKQGRAPTFGFLGVAPRNLEQPEVLAGRQGVKVNDVVPGTPAQKSGLQPNDVITHVNGDPVYDADNMVFKVGSLSSDTVARLTIERDGRVIPKNVELAKYRVTGRSLSTEPEPLWRGLRVEHWTAVIDVARNNRADIDLQGCVVVAQVEEHSAAWKAGLRPDMVITYVGGTRVSSPREFLAATAGKNASVKLRQAVANGRGGASEVVHTIAAEE